MKPLKLPPLNADVPIAELTRDMRHRAFLRQLENHAIRLGPEGMAKTCPCGRKPWEHEKTSHLYYGDRIKLYNPEIRSLLSEYERVWAGEEALREIFSEEEGTGGPGDGVALPDPSAEAEHQRGGLES